MNLSAENMDLNDLPKYTPWIDYIIGLKNNRKKIRKTAKEIIRREYDKEKWGVLLEKLKVTDNICIDEVDAISEGSAALSPFFYQGRLQLAKINDIQRIYFSLIVDELATLFKNLDMS